MWSELSVLIGHVQEGGGSLRFDRRGFEATLQFFVGEGLLAQRDPEQVLLLLEEEFEFAPTLRFADSIHVHVEVDDLATLPHEKIESQTPVTSVSRHPDIMRYGYDSGLGMIFSSSPIAQDDLIQGAVSLAKPYVDHLGVDMRDETAPTRAAFEAISETAAKSGWRHVHQPGPLYCCYVELGEKRWVYPPEGPTSWRRPIEFAFGTLKVLDEHMGCDYRPIDPAHALAMVPVPARGTDCVC